MDDLIQRAPVIEGLPAGECFRSIRLGGWNVGRVCRSLTRGVSLCPRWAVEVVKLPQQDTPLFINSSRTRLLTIPPTLVPLPTNPHPGDVFDTPIMLNQPCQIVVIPNRNFHDYCEMKDGIAVAVIKKETVAWFRAEDGKWKPEQATDE